MTGYDFQMLPFARVNRVMIMITTSAVKSGLVWVSLTEVLLLRLLEGYRGELTWKVIDH